MKADISYEMHIAVYHIFLKRVEGDVKQGRGVIVSVEVNTTSSEVNNVVDFSGGSGFDSLDSTFSFGEGAETVKETSTSSDTLKSAVNNFTKLAVKASKSKDIGLVNKVVSLGGKILDNLWTLTKQALEMAIHKFIIELAAMVISALASVWMSRHNSKGFDISTPNVYFNQNSSTVTNNPSSNTNNLNNRPNNSYSNSQSTLWGDPWGNTFAGGFSGN